MNQVQLVGRLGTDPDLTYTQGGKAVCKFRIATDRGWGENKETDWHQIIVWDKQAESCAKYLAKGRQVAVSGRIQYRKWDKDDGSTQWFTEIVAHQVEFIGEKGNQEQRGGKPRRRPDHDPRKSKPPVKDEGQFKGEFDDSFSDNDIPF